MGTTANYSWPTPVATDLVKDGWEAIKDLGDAADTTVKAVSDAQGLVHIETSNFTTSSAEIFTDVFSATYDNYLITFSVDATVDTSLYFRMRDSGGNNATGTDYARQQFRADNTTLTGSRQTGQAQGEFTVHNNGTDNNAGVVNLFRPFLAKKTLFTNLADYGASTTRIHLATGEHSLTNSYPSIQIYPASGTITGQISIYGYRKA